MENIAQSTKENNSKVMSVEKSILAKSKEQDYQRCCSAHFNIFSDEIEAKPLDSDSEGNFDNKDFYFQKHEDLKFACKLKCVKFFSINEINLLYIKKKNKRIQDFFDFAFPSKVNDLWVIFCAGINLNRSNYFNSLIKISYKVTQSVGFENLCLSAFQLKRLVSAYRHVDTLKLWSCKLSIPNAPDFSKALYNCKLKQLSLIGSGSLSLSDWKNNFNEFKNLIQGLASSTDLRASLETVNINFCEIERNEAEEFFEANQLGGVEILVCY
ncbi:unnamed protein product [Moneuplotes crassus]|uniref:Uncharacterized protein n=1 Tax=Euplotes crassus TaxID=5936 RepID=A0AAD1XFI6_EUPCR|nr:unnamed protein product [Moneuplotes crassus]